jgi:hypothetical protein
VDDGSIRTTNRGKRLDAQIDANHRMHRLASVGGSAGYAKHTVDLDGERAEPSPRYGADGGSQDSCRAGFDTSDEFARRLVSPDPT